MNTLMKGNSPLGMIYNQSAENIAYDKNNSVKDMIDTEYSTSERVVGKWINGKPIYQKTVNFGALPNNTVKYVAHGISNLDYMVDMFGCSMDSSNSVIPIPDANKNAIYGVYIVISGNNIAIETGVDRSGFTRTYITLRYTKTTD